MTISANSVIGLKIITINNGKHIGDVQDLIYDPVQNKVRAILIDNGGWFSDAKIIMFADVKNIGQDAVMVESEDAIKAAGEVTDRVANIARDDKYLTKTKIITQSGTELGQVTDLLFDSATGRVDEFEVSQGGLKDLATGRKHVKVNDIMTVGEDATIVSSYTEAKFEQQSGGIKGAVETGVEKSKQTAQQVQEKVTPMVEVTRDKVTSTVHDAQKLPDNPQVKEAVNTLRDNISTAANNLKESAKDIAHDAKEKGGEVRDKLAEQTEVLANEPEVKNTVKKVKSDMRQAQQKAANTVNQAQASVKDKINNAGDSLQEAQIHSTVGKYLTKNIISPQDDHVIGHEGEVVTYSLVNEARKLGIVDQVINNASEDDSESAS